MKNITGLVVVFLFIMSTSLMAASGLPRIYDSKKGEWTNYERVAEKLRTHQLVFVGEKHDHATGHAIEFKLLRMLFSQGAKPAVSLEMFERDTQFVLDGYLAGEVSEKFFLHNSRPWGNYPTDYRPLVEFAKTNSLPVLASNVPRRYAAMVAKGQDDVLEQLPEKEKSFFAFPILDLEGRYRDKFFALMTGGHVPPAMVQRYYRSQCLKDDTMAMSILEYLESNPDGKLISYTGSFHSDEHLGVVEKVEMKKPEIKTLVISIVALENEDEIPEVSEFAHLGDIVILAK